jgi:hypothetical protein
MKSARTHPPFECQPNCPVISIRARYEAQPGFASLDDPTIYKPNENIVKKNTNSIFWLIDTPIEPDYSSVIFD